MTKLYLIDEAAGILDEVQAWFLAKADNEGWVYTMVLRQLVNRLYRDRDYQAKRVKQGRHTAYDYALDRDQKALAWTIRALVQFVPPEEKAKVEPPKKPKQPARRLSPAQRTVYKGRPSWNGMPKRDWESPDLPPAPGSPPTPSATGWDPGDLGASGESRGVAPPAAEADEQATEQADEATPGPAWSPRRGSGGLGRGSAWGTGSRPGAVPPRRGPGRRCAGWRGGVPAPPP
jgi:hypothetical protein